MNKRKRIRFMVLMVFATVPGLAAAGSGMIVFDPQNYLKNIITAQNSIRQVENQVMMYKNQLQGLMYQAQNLKSLGNFTSLGGIESELQNVIGLQESLSALHNDLSVTNAAVGTQYQAYIASDLTPTQYFQAQQQAGAAQYGTQVASYRVAEQEISKQIPQDYANVQHYASLTKLSQTKGVQANLTLLNEQMNQLLRQNNQLLKMAAASQSASSTENANRTKDTEKAIKEEKTRMQYQNENTQNMNGWFQQWDSYGKTK